MIIFTILFLVGLSLSTFGFAENLIFSTTLGRGSRGLEVKKLQEFLKTMSDIYPEGLITGYFGASTEKAVKRFQAKYGIEPIGIVGPKTRRKLGELFPNPAQKSLKANPSPIFEFGNRQQTQNQINRSITTQQSPDGDCIKNPLPIFTHEFTDLSKIVFVTPIGGINVGTQSRSYIQVKKDASGNWPMVPIYSPDNAILKAIYYADRTYPSGVRGEYRLEFQISCEVTFVFDHIVNVSDKIKALASKTPANDSHTGVYVSLPVEAGEQLGSTNGTGIAGTWDFYVFNTTKPEYHINPIRWQSEHNKYADCPYDYFTSDLKNQYYNILANWEGTKIDPPNCGQASHDVAGTLAGGWFLGDSTDQNGSELLIGSNFNLVEVLFNRPNQPRFGFRAHSFSIRPEIIKSGNSVCYSENNNYTYFTLISDTTLLSASGSGSCPENLPATYETWNR